MALRGRAASARSSHCCPNRRAAIARQAAAASPRGPTSMATGASTPTNSRRRSMSATAFPGGMATTALPRSCRPNRNLPGSIAQRVGIRSPRASIETETQCCRSPRSRRRATFATAPTACCSFSPSLRAPTASLAAAASSQARTTTTTACSTLPKSRPPGSHAMRYAWMKSPGTFSKNQAGAVSRAR